MTPRDYAAAAATATLEKPKGDKVIELVPATKRRQAIEELNREYAVILVGGQPAILRETTDAEGKPRLAFMSVEGFHQWLRPRVLKSEDESARRVQVSKVWFESDLRREYDDIVFAPQAEVSPRFYNLWRGFAIQPSEAGSCELFMQHLLENICGGNGTLFRWVVGWFAQLLQNPGEKLGTSLVLKGAQGTGKTIIGKVIGHLIGQRHYQLVSDAQRVAGRFNSHLASCLLLQLDEAVWGGNHEIAGKLKDLVTGSSHLIEYKGKEPITVRNYVRLLVTSNNDWVVPAGLEERRFCVIQVGEDRRQDREFFGRMQAELEAGGYGRLLWELLRVDTATLGLGTIPQTEALLEQKLRSLSPEQAWWLDILHRGALPGDAAGSGVVSVDRLHAHYVEATHAVGVSRRATATVLGKFIKTVCPDVRRDRPLVVTPGGSSRRYVYEFPTLRQCREAFAARVVGGIDWSDLDEEWSSEAPT